MVIEVISHASAPVRNPGCLAEALYSFQQNVEGRKQLGPLAIFQFSPLPRPPPELRQLTTESEEIVQQQSIDFGSRLRRTGFIVGQRNRHGLLDSPGVPGTSV